MKYLYIIIITAITINAKECTYTTYTWNVNSKSITNYKRVSKPYDRLTIYERDQKTGCTVCLEDQIEIKLANIKPFKVCKFTAPRIEQALRISIENGKLVDSVVGYRVGQTRGDVDKNGNRTRFSNHSFGIAIDINQEHNGLYDKCLIFSSDCRLIRGGRWDVNHPKSLNFNSLLVRIFKDKGFKWGGEIDGWQKDFMHFSPTGY